MPSLCSHSHHRSLSLTQSLNQQIRPLSTAVTIASHLSSSLYQKQPQILPTGQITSDKGQVSKHQMYVIPFGTPPTRGPAVQVFLAWKGCGRLEATLPNHRKSSVPVTGGPVCLEWPCCFYSLSLLLRLSSFQIPSRLSGADLDICTIDRPTRLFIPCHSN